nr:uncharacterized protein CFP56_02793 [Quercus suber]
MAQPQGLPTPLKPWTSTLPRRYRLVNASLIDPKDGQVYTNVTLDLQDGLVSKMTKLSTNSTSSAPEETLKWTQGEHIITTVDLAGKFVLPGLIDCHVHLACPPGESGVQDTLTQDVSTSLLRQPYVAREMLRRGFTSIRDCGGAGLALKEAFEEGLFPAPRLFIAGHAISQTGGHGDLRGAKTAEYACCGGNTKGLGRIADGVEQCLHAAREELRQGADFIKIMVSGGGESLECTSLGRVYGRGKSTDLLESRFSNRSPPEPTIHACRNPSIHQSRRGRWDVRDGTCVYAGRHLRRHKERCQRNRTWQLPRRADRQTDGGTGSLPDSNCESLQTPHSLSPPPPPD